MRTTHILSAGAIVGLLSLIALSGCHRGYYRRMADAEAKQLIAEKAYDPRWAGAEQTIEIDPQSRMFNPFSEDHPPIPPDDPDAHEFMHRVDGRKGYPHWHANGDTDYVENPEWVAMLPMNERGEVILNFDRAIELSLIHSPTYQRQREELYLSALDVALERFGFDSQMFAGFNTFAGTQGRLRPGGSQTTLSSQLGATGGGINYRKLGVTGANLTVGLANSIIWNFAGPSTTQSASSLINFSLIQPLLRGGGRERILESLTLAERTLLANVRQMERFRQGFNLEITIGRSAGQGPSRGGGFLGLPGSATQNAGGFLGLLQTKQNIRIQEFNVQQLGDTLLQLNEFFLRERITQLQVSQTEAILLQAQTNLLQQKTNYQNALDQFKRSLGLPPDLPVSIEDDYLDAFELLSDSILDKLRKVSALRQNAGDQINRVFAVIKPDTDLPLTVEQLSGQDLVEEVNRLRPFVQQAMDIANELLTSDRDEIERDIQKLESVRGSRLEYLANLRDRVTRGEILGDVNTEVLSDDSVARPEEERVKLGLTLAALTRARDRMEGVLQRIESLEEDRRTMLEGANGVAVFVQYLDDQLLLSLADQLSQLNNLTTEISLVQSLVRSDSISLPEIDIDEQSALEIARCFRLDWMNARMGLVDSWRQIEVVANSLESQVDFVLEGSMGNFGDNPFKVRYENGSLRGGFRFDSPLTRLVERNQYRQTLIRYQQARRSYYQFEDEVSRNLRQTLRTIDLNRILFELSRRNIQVSIRQVENARLRIEQPVRVGQGQSALGDTTARDLTDAINRLQVQQSQLLNVWISYEVLRRGLDFDLGTFTLDEFGRWIDPGTIDRDIGYRVAERLGLDPTCLDCNLPPNMERFDRYMRVLEPGSELPPAPPSQPDQGQ